MNKILTLVTGGVRSGKSRLALDLFRERAGETPACFIATAEPFDADMRLRISRHQQERGGNFYTIEEPLKLGKTLEKIQAQFDWILIDCLTVWINNLLFHDPEPHAVAAEVTAFLQALEQRISNIVVVTNEVGSGIVSGEPLSRRYVDELGHLNQQAARLSDEVIFMVSGIPQTLKGNHDVPLPARNSKY